MSDKIPIIGPREAKLLLRFFVSVDRCLSSRFSLGFAPDEEHLTSLLTELLDQRGSTLHPLDYSLTQLNSDLLSSESLLQVELSISSNKYNRHQESKSTQADLGLTLNYRDHIRRKYSFHKAALFQAKRLFPDDQGRYQLSSEYRAYREKQHAAFEALEANGDPEHRDRPGKRSKIGKCFYMLYNPSLSSFDAHDQERIRHQQVRADAASIFDYTHGLHLHSEMIGEEPTQTLSDLATMVCGLSSVYPPEPTRAKSYPTFESVLGSSNLRQSSLPWFLVFDFMAGHAGSADPGFLHLVRTGGSVAKQEDARIEFLAPRYVLNVTVHGGTDPERQHG